MPSPGTYVADGDLTAGNKTGGDKAQATWFAFLPVPPLAGGFSEVGTLSDSAQAQLRVDLRGDTGLGVWLASLCSHTSRAGLIFSQGSLGLCNSSHGPSGCLWGHVTTLSGLNSLVGIWGQTLGLLNPINLFLPFSGILAGHLNSKMSSLHVFFRRIPLSMQG